MINGVMTTEDIYSFMTDKRRLGLIHYIRNRTHMSFPEAREFLDRCWPTGSEPSKDTAKDLYCGIRNDIVDKLKSEQATVLGILVKLDNQIHQMENE